MSGRERSQQIAVLGGGIAALAAVYELTEVPGYGTDFEITVYQQGHRLGGKCASSRAVRDGVERIEEHGLHMFFGFYENAFDLMRRCYRELAAVARADGERHRMSFDEAFLPHDLIMLGSHHRAGIRSWTLPFPRRDGLPGVADGNPTHVDAGTILAGLLELTVAQLLNVQDVQIGGFGAASNASERLARELARLKERPDGGDLMADVLRWARLVQRSLGKRPAPGAYLQALRLLTPLVMRLGKAGSLKQPLVRRGLASLLASLRAGLLRALRHRRLRGFRVHELRVTLDMFLSVAVGLLREGLLDGHADWFGLDDIDYRTWLRRHGAHEETIHAAPLLTLADATFSDPKSAGAGAGTTLYLTLRLLLTYKQSVVFRLGAGMGETVIAPLYRVLRDRGVKFRFFHRIEGLLPGEHEGRPVVRQIQFRSQASVKGGPDAYRPLLPFADGVLCFPDRPDYTQLVEGEALRQQQIDLEDSWNRWDPGRPLETLDFGRDYDVVLLGISLGGLKPLCQDLIAFADARGTARAGRGTRPAPTLSEMLSRVRTIETVSAQLWFKPTFEELGAPAAGGVGVEYPQPFDTWAEMNHLLPHERWPAQAEPGSLVYLCSARDEPLGYEPPSFRDHEHTARRRRAAKQELQRWLDRHGPQVFRRATVQGRFNYDLLADPLQRSGQARLDAQFWCATVNPSDRYVLSAPGTNRYRLRPHESGFDNLVLTGDWLLTCISAGCVEGAVVGGREAARALTGTPRHIEGDWLTQRHPELLCEPILPRFRSAREPANPANTNAAPTPGDEPPASGVYRSPAASFGRPGAPANLPLYVRRPFDVIASPTYVCRDAQVDWFFFSAERKALSRLCDQLLNHPSSPTIFEPLLPVIAFVASSTARIYSGTQREGYLPEKDFGFWFPVRARARAGLESLHLASPISWFQPCLWVDSGPAMVGGRDYLGMNKMAACLRLPSDKSPCFSIDTIVAKGQRVGLSEDVEAGMARLLELHVAGPRRGWDDERLEVITRDSSPQLASALESGSADWLSEFLHSLSRGPVPLIGLKQFPDAERPELACYKSVIEAHSRPIGDVRVRIWRGRHELRIYPFASHPVACILGLKVRAREQGGRAFASARALLAVSTAMDFELEPGRVVFDFVQAQAQRDAVQAAE